VSKFKLAIIDDDIVDIWLYEEILISAFPECEVNKFCSLGDVKDRLLEFKPDIILLDFNLSDSTAFDVIEFVKPKLGELPIIVITGVEDKSIITKLYDVGIYNYIKKDVTKNLLPNVLNNAVSQYNLKSSVRILNKRLKIQNFNFKLYVLLYLLITAFILYFILK